MQTVKNFLAILGGLITLMGVIVLVVTLFLGWTPKIIGINAGPVNFEMHPPEKTFPPEVEGEPVEYEESVLPDPSRIVESLSTPTFPPPTSLNVSVIGEADTSIMNCDFINEIGQKSVILKWIDTPIDSGSWSGVQVRIITTLSIPKGWIIQRGLGDEHGPIELQIGDIVSIYSPNICRPLTQFSNTTNLNCSFLDELHSKVDIIQLIYVPSGINNYLAGAQVRTLSEVTIPIGWVFQRGIGDEYGPAIIPENTVVSIYSPESCRPLK